LLAHILLPHITETEFWKLVSASLAVARIAMEMKQQVFYVAAYWLTTYITFSALVSILHSITKYPHHPAALDPYQNAIEGESALVYLAKNEASLQASALALFSSFRTLSRSLQAMKA
jgi:hypothetical protein